ncbi:hypothetical protein [Caballeronia terrestris]|uniref:hypothetical protein n=1 Tax=Caballeronia terrestris TaxID=1226301 RepID=UPI000ACCD7E0|nr:hypothetical protein [Caballeronia terrestris]
MAARAAERLSPDLRDELSKLNAEMPTLARNGSKLRTASSPFLTRIFTHGYQSKAAKNWQPNCPPPEAALDHRSSAEAGG